MVNMAKGRMIDRPKTILILGMSYSHLREEYDLCDLIEMVRTRQMNEIDGRDQARIMSIEKMCDHRVMTVSTQTAREYHPERHLNACFNHRTFIAQLRTFLSSSSGVMDRRISQVYLDYYWSPRLWTKSTWRWGLFSNLIKMVDGGMFNCGGDNDWFYDESGNYVDSMFGVVYLPLCDTCVDIIIDNYDYFSDRFFMRCLYKWELDEHHLWKGLDENQELKSIMKSVFGKQPNQEDEYCKLTDEATGWINVPDSHDLRMIKLMVLRSKGSNYNPAVDWPTDLGVTRGGFIGLEPK